MNLWVTKKHKEFHYQVNNYWLHIQDSVPWQYNNIFCSETKRTSSIQQNLTQTIIFTPKIFEPKTNQWFSNQICYCCFPVHGDSTVGLRYLQLSWVHSHLTTVVVTIPEPSKSQTHVVKCNTFIAHNLHASLCLPAKPSQPSPTHWRFSKGGLRREACQQIIFIIVILLYNNQRISPFLQMCFLCSFSFWWLHNLHWNMITVLKSRMITFNLEGDIYDGLYYFISPLLN
jgi:hypothetical protein